MLKSCLSLYFPYFSIPSVYRSDVFFGEKGICPLKSILFKTISVSYTQQLFWISDAHTDSICYEVSKDFKNGLKISINIRIWISMANSLNLKLKAHPAPLHNLHTYILSKFTKTNLVLKYTFICLYFQTIETL